jgi:hypothetical protein
MSLHLMLINKITLSFGYWIVYLWFTASDYPFGIFWLLNCLPLIYSFWLSLWYLLAVELSTFDLQLLITPLVSFGYWIVYLWFTDSDYPFGIFWLLNCLPLIYSFWLPLWYLLAVELSTFDLQLLITPLVSFGYWIVYLWFTASDYPFGIFWLLNCLPLIYSFWLPLRYLLAIELSTFDLQLLITPLVSFGCWIVYLWFTASDYPFGIFCLLNCLPLIYSFWLPFRYLLAIELSTFDLQLLITPLWYLLAIELSTFDLQLLITSLWYLHTFIL